MPDHSDSIAELTQQVYAHLRAGNYRAALAVAGQLAEQLDGAAGERDTAEAWVAVSRARREMGRFADAEAAALRALSALATTVGREHPLYAAGVRELARTYEELGRYAQAESLDRQALAVRRRALGDHHADTAESLSDLTAVLGWLGRYAESDACGAEAVTILTRPEHARHPIRPYAIINDAYVLSGRGNSRAAVERATEAYRLAEQLYPARHPELASFGVWRARLLLVDFRTEPAERLLTDAVDVRRTVLGEAHPHSGAALVALAEVRRSQGRAADAERMLRDAVRIVEAALGEGHHRAAEAGERLAAVLLDRAESEEAEALYRKAIATYESTLGPDNTTTLDATVALAGLLTQTGRASEAETLLRGVLDRYTAECPVGLSEAHAALARVLGEQGCLTAALDEAATSLRILRALPGVAASWLAQALNTLSWYQLETGDVAAGAESAQEAFNLTFADAGRNHAATLEAARWLASAHLKQGDAVRAEQVLRRAMTYAPDTTPRVDLRADLARALAAQTKDQEAEELYLRLVTERRKPGGDEAELADALLDLGSFYEGCGNPGAALPRYREALDIRRAVEGPSGIGVARVLHTLAEVQHRTGNAAAFQTYEQALETYRASAGEDSADYGVCQHALARLYLDAGDAGRAETTVRAAVDTLARRGERNAEHLAARQSLALVLASTGNYSDARDVLLAVLAIHLEGLGAKHATTLGTQAELSNVYLAEGDLLAAEPLIRDLADRNRELYPGDAALSRDEGRLAQLYARLGEYEPARRHADRYLSIVRTAGGPNSPAYAFGLLLLADVHLLRDDYTSALAATRDALAIRRRELGESHPLVAAGLQRLAALEFDLGRWADARAHAAAATALVRKLVGPDDPAFARALRTEAAVNAVAAPDAAGDLLGRAVVLERKCFGDYGPARVPGILERADWHLRRREYAPAKELLLEAGRILQQATLEENVLHVGVASRLANVMMRTQREASAGRYLHQAFDIAVRMFGREHPDVTVGARRLAWWHASQGERAVALETIEAARPGEDTWAEIAGDTAYAYDRFRSASDAILTDRFRVSLLARDPGADVEPAYARLLRDRGREAALIGGPPLARVARGVSGRAEQVTRCRRLRVQLVETTLAGPGFEKPEAHLARLTRWRAEERRLAAEFPSAPAVGVQTIADALPTNGTLVEFLRVIEDFDGQDRSGYVAFLLPAGGAAELRLIDLGSAAEIDRLAGEWSAALARGADAREAATGRQLAQRLLVPLLPHLDGDELFVVPDTALRALPFAALPTSGGGRVVDRFVVTLLTSASALLNLPPPPAKLNPLVVAERSRGGLFAWLRRMLTGRGGAALAARLGVNPRHATGEWLRDTRAGVVHVAVPGLLQAEPPFDTDKPAPRFLDPLTRYGARWNSGPVNAAQLREVELVPGATIVMPETVPVPGPAGAEALTWVSRAFRHAGAAAVIAGLWQAPFAEGLWTAFHGGVQDGDRPAVALRRAQLRAKHRTPSPHTWAGFVCFAG